MSISISILVLIFFLTSYLLIPKIEICHKYFLDKKSPKAAIVLGCLAYQRPPAGSLLTAYSM